MHDATTLLFGLPGLQVVNVTRRDDGARIIDAVTDEDIAGACPSCGVFSTSRKQRTTTTPKDIPYGDDRIILHWNKTRWRCREDYCNRKTFTDTIEQIPARARTTGRLRSHIGAAIGDAARPVTEVAYAFSVSWPTAHRAFVEHADARLTEPTLVRALGIDETRRGKPRRERCTDTGKWVRVDPWDTGFVDLDGDQGILGQAQGRTSKTVVDWLLARTLEFREGIEYVAIDPAAVHAKAVRTPGLLPNAVLVVDHFHLVQLSNTAVTKVRRRVTWELKDRRGGKIEPSEGQSQATADRSGTLDTQELYSNVERADRRGPVGVDPCGVHRERGVARPVLDSWGRWGSASDAESVTQFLRVVAGDQRVPAHWDHECSHRGLQPVGQVCESFGVWVS